MTYLIGIVAAIVGLMVTRQLVIRLKLRALRGNEPASAKSCQMSMDIMGVVKEELIDGLELGGVASYLESASSAAVNLFI